MPDFDPPDKFKKSLEHGVAQAIAEDHREELLYNHQSQQFIMLNPSTMTWLAVEDKEVISAVREFILGRPEFVTKESTRVQFWRSVTKHLKLCQPVPVMPVPGIMS